MSRAYGILLALVVAAALGLGAFARMPRRVVARAAPVEVAPMAPVALALAVERGGIVPEHSAVPKDRRVRLTVINRGSVAVSLRLAGYEDRVTLGPLAPGVARTIEFLADRPGEDFAWMLDGRPAGRLAVTGSHLMDGHR
jgi:hypothetical protein